MNKKILSVSQRMQKERLCGVIYLIGGLIFSCKGIEKNLILVACFCGSYDYVYNFYYYSRSKLWDRKIWWNGNREFKQSVSQKYFWI